MKRTKLIALLGGIACACLVAPNAQALSVTDPGVVGWVDPGTASANPGNATAWANYLLGLGANTYVVADSAFDNDSANEEYQTGPTDYNGTLSGGTEVNGVVTAVSSWTWVMAKYDGQNAGYVLFYVPDLLNGTIPEFSYGIWGNNSGQYQMSHIVGFGGRTSVPDGGTTMMLLGSALAGLGVMRRRFKL